MVGKRTFAAIVSVALVLAVAPGWTSTSYAAPNPAALTVELEGACFEGRISPDSLHYVCYGDQDAIEGWELYSVPIDGSAPATRLSPSLSQTMDHVWWFDVTPDGATVVFAQGGDPDEPPNEVVLYSIPIGGGQTTQLTPQLAEDDVLWLPELSPDGTRVVFWGYNETPGGGRLQSVRVNGTGLITIAEVNNPQWFGLTGTISPDSQRVLYYTGYPANEAHSVDIAGGTPVKISGPNPAGGDIESGVITPDSSHFIYRADFDTAGVFELYAAPLAGGEVKKLNHSLEAGESVLEEYEVLPDSSSVLYSVPGPIVPIWYHVPIDYGTPAEISPAIFDVQVTADSTKVVFDNTFLVAHTLGSGQEVELGDHGSFRVSPDSATVWLWQKEYTDPVAHLYSVPIGGGEHRPHVGAVVPTSQPYALIDHIRMQITPDSTRFIYVADTNGDGSAELMVAPVNSDDAYEVATDVHVLAPNESDYSGIHISPDSRRVVYYRDPYGPNQGVYSTLLTRHPEVADSNWIVAEDEPLGALVGTVDAVDPDGDSMTLGIIEGGDRFDIDAASGEITVAALLDRETHAEHQLTVEVDDGIVASTAVVTIAVGDVNDNPPIASDVGLIVAEDTAPGTALGLVDSVDADDDVLSHSLASPNPLFEVDVDGTITLIDTLDFDIAASHRFTVEVSDGVFTDTATVSVSVTEVPDTTTPPSTTTTTTAPQPPPPPAPPEFDDVPEHSLFHRDIAWLAGEGITKGCNPPVNNLFCPEDQVTRGQMAAFLHRALGSALEIDGAPVFTDDDESVFETDIEWLGATGVTRGCNPPSNNQYCPGQPVTRGQMAAFLVRALGLPTATQGDLFTDDDDSVFEHQIDALASAGITSGCNPPTNDQYCPDQPVTRGQMAAFLHRALGD